MLSITKKLIPILIVAILFSSCSLIKKQISKEPVVEKSSRTASDEYVWSQRTNSDYNYNQLDEKLKKAYSDIAKGCLELDEVIETAQLSPSELEEVIPAVLRDYPIIDWVDKQYSYSNALGKTTIKLSYTRKKEDVRLRISQLDGHAAVILKDISPNMSDYEKALIVHDKLVNSIEYTLDVPNQHNVYGALVDKQATCEGYAKAYQFLLLKLGLNTIVVYGDAGGPHAWNMVELNGNYYNVDVTFDDRSLSNGSSYISREYAFVNDEQMSKTHTPSSDISNTSLPKCDKISLNYFVYNDLIVNDADKKSLQAMVRDLTKNSISQMQESFQIKIISQEVLASLNSSFFETGELDTTINTQAERYNGVSYIGRTYEPATGVMTFMLKYQ